MLTPHARSWVTEDRLVVPRVSLEVRLYSNNIQLATRFSQMSCVRKRASCKALGVRTNVHSRHTRRSGIYLELEDRCESFGSDRVPKLDLLLNTRHLWAKLQPTKLCPSVRAGLITFSDILMQIEAHIQLSVQYWTWNLYDIDAQRRQRVGSSVFIAASAIERPQAI